MERSQKRSLLGASAAGLAAGTVNGIFGGGGGMVLIPALQLLAHAPQESLFPMSVSVMLPVSILSLAISARWTPLPWAESAPYLIGSAIGGVLVGLLGKKIPTLWMHRIFGIMILWGGIRYLC